MSARPTRRRRTLAALTAPLALAAAIGGSTTTAQAHDDVWSDHDTRQTSNCPCYLWDEYDWTHFKHDAGGKGARARFYSGSQLFGKMEFHPRNEEIWLYDTLPNNDAIYFQIQVGEHWGPVFRIPSGQRHMVAGYNIEENQYVTIHAYDSLDSDGEGKDLITSITGRS